jgi:hypothetical protein
MMNLEGCVWKGPWSILKYSSSTCLLLCRLYQRCQYLDYIQPNVRMNGELEKICMEAAVVYSRYYPEFAWRE